MTLENLVNKQGSLAKIFLQFDSNTIQHSREITNDRRILENEAEREELRKAWFWTVDFSLYTIEDNDVVLYLGERKNNLIFKNIEEATNQLAKNNNYIPKKEDIETVISSKSTLITKLSDLELKEHDDELSYFEIDTVKYNGTLNKAQRTFAERVYGQEDDFKNNMKMFRDASISTTRIYVLNPKYVKNHVKEGSAIARACGLGSFDYSSDFNAYGRGVGGSSVALRGVPKVAEGDDVAQKIIKMPEEEVHKFIEKYVAPINTQSAKQEMKKLYR